MENISQILLNIKKMKGFSSDTQIAEALEMTQSALSNHKSRGTIPFESIITFCENENISLDMLLFDRPVIEENQIEKNTEDNGYIHIPQVNGEICAGNGFIPDNTIELKIAFRKEWIQRKGDPKNMSLIRVRGDSMEPTLLSGDIVLIDHSHNYVDPQGGIYAIAIGDAIMIKRIHILFPLKKIRIISDNNKYEPIEAESEQLKINGKVIWFGREIEK